MFCGCSADCLSNEACGNGVVDTAVGEVCDDGKLGVETSLADLSAEEVIRQYRDLRQIEDAFRSLKSTLKLRPMHHWTPKRIEAHVFLCIIALTLERIMRLRLQRSGETMHPSRVLSRLKTIRAVTLRTSGGVARGVTRVSPEQLALYKALGISPPVAKDVL
jgi:transposase